MYLTLLQASIHSKEMAESVAGAAGVGAALGAAFGTAVGTAGGGPAAGLLGAAVGGLAGGWWWGVVGAELHEWLAGCCQHVAWQQGAIQALPYASLIGLLAM